MANKRQIRAEMRSRLLAQSASVIGQKSRVIEKKLLETEGFRSAACIFFYVALPTEVQTASLIEKVLRDKKRVLVPFADLENKEIRAYEIKHTKNDLKKGTLDIYEPDPRGKEAVHPTEIDCVLVPGLAFDKKGSRLGRGAGFYDRFLTKLRPDAFKIALAFSFQVLPTIPLEDHDMKVDLVLTD